MSENNGLVGCSVDLIYCMGFIGIYVRRQYHPFLCGSGEVVAAIFLVALEPVWVVEGAGANY